MTQLSSKEEGFKELYLKYHPYKYELPLTIEEFKDYIDSVEPKYQKLFQTDFAQSLNEDVFFEDTQDIVAIQHYRYMPPSLHNHTFFELAYVVSGRLTNYIGLQQFELNQGDLLILPPGTQHAVFADNDDAVLINILIRSSTFEQHFLNIMPKHELFYDFFVKTLYEPSTTPYLLFKTGDDKELAEQIFSIQREFNMSRRYKETVLLAETSLMLATLLRSHELDVIIPSINPSVMNENTLLIIQFMQKQYTHISLHQLATFFNYSDRQVQRIITQATGMSFSDNIKKMRMLKAVELLETTNLPITAIAEYLGYYDASNFRQLFKKYYGRTPQSYRSEK